VLLGTRLNGASIVPQPKAGVEITESGTAAFFTLSVDQTDGLKQVIIKHGTDSPVLVSIPDSKRLHEATTVPHDRSVEHGSGIHNCGNDVGFRGIDHYLGKQIPFSLSLDKKSLVVNCLTR